MSIIDSVLAFASAHPILWGSITSAATAFAGVVWSAFVSSLPSPTAQSTPQYQFWFKFFNYLAANISRARNNSIESSPNFIPAVNAQMAKTGEKKVVVEVDTAPSGK